MRNTIIVLGVMAALGGVVSEPAVAQVATGVGVGVGAVVAGPVGAVVGGVIGNSLDRRPYRVVPSARSVVTPRRHYVRRRAPARTVRETSAPTSPATSVTAASSAATAPAGTTTTVVH